MVQKFIITTIVILISFNSLIVPASALSTNTNGDSVTNKLSAELDLSAEMFSDVKIVTTGPKSFKDDQLKVSNSDGRVSLSVHLGSQSDERDGCVEAKNNRRVGICEDGIYTSIISSFDAGGNKSENSKFRIERDTVNPFVTSVNIQQNINKLNFTIKAEANSEIFINEISVGFANSNGNFSFNQFIICGIEYNFKVYSKDLAGNKSGEISKEYKTSYCGIGGTINGDKNSVYGDQRADQLADPEKEIGSIYITRNSNGTVINKKINLKDLSGPKITYHNVNFDGSVNIYGLNYYIGQRIGKVKIIDEQVEFTDELNSEITKSCEKKSNNTWNKITSFLRITKREIVRDEDCENKIKTSLYRKEFTAYLEVNQSKTVIKNKENKIETTVNKSGQWDLQSDTNRFKPEDQILSIGNYSFNIKNNRIIKINGEDKIQKESNYFLFESIKYNEMKFELNDIPGDAISIKSQELSIEGSVHPLKNCQTRSLNQPFRKVGNTYFHNGVDFGAEVGCDIVAFKDGKIVFAGWKDDGSGFHVEIDHEDGSWTRYLHGLNEPPVVTGQRVNAGDHILDLGSSGHSTGPHLHFEIWDRKPWTNHEEGSINPDNYIFINF